ncbi:MAG: diaminohydroxyphosphoribosylaminopyrimidine deaminase [Candidatus Latescibacterota bacterium]
MAKNGLGTTYPNPLVGSVVVYNDIILGEGWHYQAGGPHAEVVAINAVNDVSMLKDATVYVSLEPCSHFGKTPPCADLIISKGIKKVVIGCKDPNPKVAGKGIQKLLAAGCEVVVGIEEAACQELNKRFFTFQQKNRPYIFLKWAQTQDGFIAPSNKTKEEPVWISNRYSRQHAHKLRATEQAILVGTKTVMDDNPTLTTRDWNGLSPLRVLLDRTLKIQKEANIFSGEAPTLILTEKDKENDKNRIYERVDFNKEIATQVCAILYRYKIQSLIVEGGTHTLQTFLAAELWDEAIVYTGPLKFESGLYAPKIDGEVTSTKNMKTDIITHYKRKHS